MFFFDRRALYAVFFVLFIMSFISMITDVNSLILMLTCVPGVLCAITFHEYAHAFVAQKLGDDDAARQGRLTMNPLKHVDPIGLAIFLMAGIGWGQPVTVNGANLKKNISYKKAIAIIAIAGPIANLLLAVVFTILYFAIAKFNWLGNMSFRWSGIITSIIYNAIILNIGFCVFNLIPLPPLDGFKVLNAFLPNKASMWFERNEMIFYIVFIVLWITGLASVIIAPFRAWIYVGIVKLVSAMFGMQI